jgi:transcriptional regulator with XRE-family HTH domain
VKTAKALTFRTFENFLCRNGMESAQVLGIAYSTYQQYRSGRKNPPRATINHIDAIQRLPLDRLHELVKDRLNDC